MTKRRTPGILSYILLILLVTMLVNWLMSGGRSGQATYGEVVALFREEKVRSFEMKDDEIYLELWETDEAGKYKHLSTVLDTDALQRDLKETILDQLASGRLTDCSIYPDTQPGILVQTMPYLLAGTALLVLWAFLGARSAGQGGGGQLSGFTKANARTGESTVTFSDVAGCDEEKEELREVVEFLQNPGKFTDMGAKIPKGFLLVGPPGTGKTLLARAVAGEAGVPFLSISGSDFVELYVGVGAGRVRDLFEQAKKVAPAIVFIDEIDAVGRRRGAGMGGGNDEREQTLNQLLVEMDGFEKTDGVIILAATNRQDVLDPALLRPGRFDRQIHVGAPDAAGREAILQIHCRKKRLADDVDLKTVALGTGGFTGADLQNLMNEAAILAVRADRKFINMSDINEAMMKVIAGPQKKSHKQLQRDRRITAIHEAGHAVAIYHLPEHDPVHQITIVPRGRAAGLTVFLPTQESDHDTRNEMYEQIVCLLGGRAAEALYCQDISAGASNDIQRATKLARDMVARFGMSERVGAVSYEDGGEIFVGRDYERTKGYSEQTAGILDEETKRLVDKAYNQCLEILKADGEKLMQVAEFLLAHETMSGKQFKDCMEGRTVSLEGKDDLFSQIENVD